MFHPLAALGWGLFGASICITSSAQQVPAAPATAPPAYRSALEGYRPFADQDVAPWKDSNQAVREAGGWRAYAREGRPAAAATPARAASAAAPGVAPSAPAGGHQH